MDAIPRDLRMACEQACGQFGARRLVRLIGVPLRAARSNVVTIRGFFEKQRYPFGMTARGQRTFLQFPLQCRPAGETVFESQSVLHDAQSRRAMVGPRS